MSVGYDEAEGVNRLEQRASMSQRSSGEDDFFANRPGQAPEEQGYENDEFADRFGSMSDDGGWTRNSFGNPVRRSGEMLRDVNRIEAGEAMSGGAQHHRQPRVIESVASVPGSGLGSGSVASSGRASGPAGARPGFFNGSFNPFKWNWRNLFKRRR